MLTLLANARRHAVAGAFAFTMIGLAAAVPANAMTDKPKEPISSTSGGSSSTSGGISSSSGGSTSSSSGGTSVPEPSSMALFGAGAAAFMVARRRRKAKQA